MPEDHAFVGPTASPSSRTTYQQRPLRPYADTVITRLRHTQREFIEPRCRAEGRTFEECYHAGGIERAIELIDALVSGVLEDAAKYEADKRVASVSNRITPTQREEGRSS